MRRLRVMVVVILCCSLTFNVIPLPSNVSEMFGVIEAKAASYSGDYRCWAQGGSDNADMRSYGCWVVAQAKLIYETSVDRSASFNPDTYLAWQQANGYINRDFNQTDGGNAPVAYANQKGKNLTYLGFWDASDSQLWFNINAGYRTILKVLAPEGFTHYVMVANDLSKEKGELYCYDSFYTSGTTNPQRLTRYATRYGGYVYSSNNPDIRAYVDGCVGEEGSIVAGGWAADFKDTAKTLEIQIYIGGEAGSASAEKHVVSANVLRSDVNDAYPGVGNYHGFHAELDTKKTGTQNVYFYVVTPGSGELSLFGISTVNIKEAAPTSIKLNTSNISFLVKGAKATLTATVSPSNAADKSVTWKSSNTSVATVNSNGVVTAVGNGTATITATTASGGKTATCNVTVSVATTGVSLNKTSATLTAKGATVALSATVSPCDAANKAVTWKSSNTSVATVNSSGVVTAVGNGTATITATTASGGKTATCKVTVKTTELIGDSNDVLSNAEGNLYVRGWVFDKVSPTEQIEAHIYIGGAAGSANTEATAIKADKLRKDVNDVYACGNYHGYEATIKTQKTGSQPIYIYAVNRTKGANKLIWKGTVTLAANSYNVKFNGNGSTSGTMSTQTMKYGIASNLKSNTFSRTGYKFTGWNTKADGSGTTYANKASVKNLSSKNGATVTLYAQWKKAKYTITYELNGGKNNSSNPTAYYVTTSTKTLNNPTRKGYTFKGWYSDSKFKTKVTQIKKGSTGNKTLYAKWAAKKYTVTYKLNGGTNNKNNPTSYYITTSTKTLNNPTRKGYTFKGWYSDSKYKTKVTQIKKGSTGNKTLYAKWVKK